MTDKRLYLTVYNSNGEELEYPQSPQRVYEWSDGTLRTREEPDLIQEYLAEFTKVVHKPTGIEYLTNAPQSDSA